jgi:hypothetical protein
LLLCDLQQEEHPKHQQTVDYCFYYIGNKLKETGIIVVIITIEFQNQKEKTLLQAHDLYHKGTSKRFTRVLKQDKDTR